MNSETFPIEVAIYSVAAVAVIALLINLKLKIPKKIFGILAVMMVLLIVWYSMGGKLPESIKNAIPQEQNSSPLTTSVIRAINFDQFTVTENTIIPIKDKNLEVIALKAFIDAPKENTESVKNFSFSLIKKDGKEIQNIAVFFEDKINPPKIVAIFKFDESENMEEFSAIKISTNGVPEYEAKGLLIETVSLKED